ncbi:MAG: hypothetical protein J0H41_12165 [Rhizobiales bacterium]|nr:hypothetical protein [Hyphomicrobiales bacterium]
MDLPLDEAVDPRRHVGACGRSGLPAGAIGRRQSLVERLKSEISAFVTNRQLSFSRLQRTKGMRPGRIDFPRASHHCVLLRRSMAKEAFRCRHLWE